jgi:hypothetical protein|tara:strand:+ start:458 stop:637 length:180 start_codon:yes stop_codon:yes gene_type:complete
MPDSLEKHGMFNTPDDLAAIESWINLHPKEERIHLYTAAYMAWNLAVEISTNQKEAIDA